jgi:predicted nuclease of predicted toxin-antitoxin system
VIVWLDNQLPPALASWLRLTFEVGAVPIRDLNLQRASDREIFAAAREAGVAVMTKDADFVTLLELLGVPPQVILVTCGNTSNAHLRELLALGWPTISIMLNRGEPLVELAEPPTARG